jgi:phospholipid N-methyltransferase
MSKPLLFLRRFVSSPLGAGTGVITEAIEQSRHDDARFLSFECDEDMRNTLEDRYPAVTFCRNALVLKASVKAHQMPSLDCVISGLPLFNFSDRQRRGLLMDIYELLNPGGVFVVFQYTSQLKPFLLSIYDDLETSLVWANLPPAYVYLCKKSA